MKVCPSLRSSGNERNAKAPAPIAEQIGQAGGLVVLVRTQLRIGDQIHRNEKQAVAESLKRPDPTEMRAIRLEIHVAVKEHCRGHKRETHQNQRFG